MVSSRFCTSILLGTLLLASACGGAPTPASPADGEPTPGPTPTDGAASSPPRAADPSATASSTGGKDEQIARGAALYGQQCAGCHGAKGEGDAKMPALVGSGALPEAPRPGSARKAPFHTAADVITFVQAAMPPKKPGSLSVEDATAIVAFALEANGVARTAPLDATAASQIVLHP